MNRRQFLWGFPALLSSGALAQSKNDLGFRFEDVTLQAGVRFVHNSGAYGAKYLPECMGSGCAFFD